MPAHRRPLSRRTCLTSRLGAIAVIVWLSTTCIPVLPQHDVGIVADGYVTAVYSPSSFEVDHKRITLSPDTTYGLIGKSSPAKGLNALHDALHLGAYVQVTSSNEKSSKSINAASVLLREDSDRKLSGLGVIDKVISTGTEPTYRADGYQLHITAGTDLTFTDELNSLADIGTNI